MSESSTADGRAAQGRHAAEHHEWQEAFDTLSAAAREIPLDPDDLDAYWTSAYLVGDVAAAVDALGRKYQRAIDAEDLGRAAQAGLWAVFVLMLRGAVAQASGWIARCSAILEELPQDAPQHGYLRCFEAFRAVAMDHDYAVGHGAASDVVARARRSHDQDLLALGLNIDGRALVRAGRVEEGMRRLDEAMVELVSGSLSPIVAGTVYCSMIEACEEIAEMQRAQEWTETLSGWCHDQHGMLTFNGQCLTHRATILRSQGKWDEAALEAEQARQAFAGAADEPATGRALYEQAEIHRLRGGTAAAEALYREAAAWGHDPQPGLALLRLAEGNVDGAAAAMRRRLAEAEQSMDLIRLLPAHVDIMLAAGAVDEAAAAADQLAQLASTYETEALRGRSHYARAAVDLARDDPEAALPALRKAASSWRALRFPYEEARTRALIARACRALDDEETADLEDRAAAETFHRLGAAAPAGGGETQPEHALSPRELEVLSLVATGMTNQQIADELYLAVKTVERHVGNILMKLDVSSRTAATAYAYEHGLV